MTSIDKEFKEYEKTLNFKIVKGHEIYIQN